ncbi:Uu.00g063790.m01.CDS01 [Anthostomella pinea]|uniref:Uu.00g063790.m01.CDS01 n=1 Tax=Anthostomella pinea TaxID=933095 RepID=A0AAI8VU73_9PEZI|nr:Uu.00g063790.m01.CDS01 [Anthostomella pinea]
MSNSNNDNNDISHLSDKPGKPPTWQNMLDQPNEIREQKKDEEYAKEQAAKADKQGSDKK